MPTSQLFALEVCLLDAFA
ncbi:DUF645 family protein [Vibrio cholerae]|nr:DUF645 family protein [Vibrio cholerae]